MSLSYNKQTVNCMANDTGSYIRVNLLFCFFYMCPCKRCSSKLEHIVCICNCKMKQLYVFEYSELECYSDLY